jgi:protein phosphatase
MGGHATGDMASSLAIQSISQKASTDLWSLQNREPEEHVAWLKSVVLAANQAVYEARLMANNDMGSTLACALLLGDQAFITHQGDSRIYLLRDGAIQLLTTDHSVVQQLVSIGKISPEQAREHPQRNVIYRSLGEKPQIDVDVSTQALQPEDMLLICSDGLNGMLDDQKIQIIVHESSSPQVACDYLIDAANLAGGEDNISIILIKVISA